MSSYVMHICISDIVKKRHYLSEKYIYGSVLPDLEKDLGCDRTLTHFTEKVETNGDIRHLPNIDKAINDLKDKMEFEVYLGYISHLIEDYIWFNKYIPLYTKKTKANEVMYLKDNTIHSLDEYRNDVYSDYRYFAKYVIDRCEVKFIEVLSNIDSIVKEDERKILLKNTNLNVALPDNEMLISKESIDQYIEECVVEVDKLLSNMLNNTKKIECKIG